MSSWFLPLARGKRAKRVSVHTPPASPKQHAAPEPPAGVHAAPPNANLATEYAQRREEASILVTDELDRAIQRCRDKVARIAKDCRNRNRRFRDIEFDLSGDRDRCLYGLVGPDGSMVPADVRRTADIFNSPAFFTDASRPGQNPIQGGLGNCWFLSALATLGTMPSLIEKICVARDEPVGVYGFIFCMDNGWVEVIVDDMLYSKVKRYEEISDDQRLLYKHDQDAYDAQARKGSKTLYFSSSGDENETWIPLIEKAYAKLYGDYKALDGGRANEALEDMTGGVSSLVNVPDILDPERFWNEELCNVKKDRLFGCFISDIVPEKGSETLVNGLVPAHAYSILGAVEVAGKRFIRIRNPWGKTEWTGRWADGSKEWTSEWLARLPELGHSFGNDGQFLMEYTDFLRTWIIIEKTLLFDPSWMLSTQWLNVTSRPYPCAWSFGDVSFTIEVKDATPAIIVLNFANTRSFKSLNGPFRWAIDYAIYKRGEDEPFRTSPADIMWTRSVSVEVELERGEYVIQVRLDRMEVIGQGSWYKRKLSWQLAAQAMSASNATNFDPKRYRDALPLPTSEFNGRDLTEIELASMNKSAPRIDPSTMLSDEPASILSAAGNTSSNPPIDSVTSPRSIPLPPTTPSEDPGAATPSSRSALPGSFPPTPNRATFPVGITDGSVTPRPPSPVSVTPTSSDNTGMADAVTLNVGEPARASSDEQSASEPEGGERADVKTNGINGVHGINGDAKADGSSKSGIYPSAHVGYSCNHCREKPIVGPRYHCLDVDCAEFNLCSKCVDAGVHPTAHAMLRLNVPPPFVPLPAQAPAVTDMHSNDGENDEGGANEGGGDQDNGNDDNDIVHNGNREDEVLLGIRVYTQRHAPAHIKGQLRRGRVLQWKKAGGTA